jgi:hypothetical protein
MGEVYRALDTQLDRKASFDEVRRRVPLGK